MIIVAGSLHVEPAERDRYVAECREVVLLARAAPGCLDFAITADTVDPGRIDVYERWRTRPELTAFRGSGPSGEQQATLLAVEVDEFEVPGTPLPPGLGRPAIRALHAAGITDLESATAVSAAHLAALHGVGPLAIGRLQDELARQGWAFAG